MELDFLMSIFFLPHAPDMLISKVAGTEAMLILELFMNIHFKNRQLQSSTAVQVQERLVFTLYRMII